MGIIFGIVFLPAMFSDGKISYIDGSGCMWCVVLAPFILPMIAFTWPIVIILWFTGYYNSKNNTDN